MQLIVNDETMEAPEKMTVLDFIQWFKQEGNFAIAVNMEFIPRSLYGETMLKEGDRIEVVLPMQGG
ncbi:sulfur carrier protein ThiS [Kangiella koreensis]|uniref:Thiamine biosynthesis protein ThiS n=1 Tax=Kangiella koreensis (strain DSM 16069 / JCM 12317 / KCTC 12182 / SW-125) TaxID=523791 RepID=C7R6N3_KANKD|nr:sulfur carrier protein ThiS [Kangiella koreensis]ACV25549.1 thiamine biosynthesis protein ThiS [Kangiella koreensis DSM 16069]